MAVAVEGATPSHAILKGRDELPTADALGADGAHVDVGDEFGAGILVFCGCLAVSGCVGAVHPVAEPRQLRGIGNPVRVGA